MDDNLRKGSAPLVGTVLLLMIVGLVLIQAPDLDSPRPNERGSGGHPQEPEIAVRLWEDPLVVLDAGICPKPINEILEKVIHVLPVMVFGSAYVTDGERRRGTRHAVLSSLATQGFVPDHPDRIGLTFVPSLWSRYDPDGRPCPADPTDSTPWFPFETLSNQVGQRLLVLWLSEEGFQSAPICLLRVLVSSVHDACASCRVTILGPAGSDLLLRMAREAHEHALWSTMPPLQVYSYSATVPDRILLSELHRANGASRGAAEEESVGALLARAGVNLLRILPDDKALLRAAVEELKHRRVDTARDSSQVIAIVSERDTLYGRAWGRSLWRVLHGPDAEFSPLETGDRFPALRARLQKVGIQTFSYMRGIDGISLPAGDEAKGDEAKKDTVGAAAGQTRRRLREEQPFGTRQTDYLQRLTERIARTTQPAAIGVLGSDIYDKILILRALRPAFPQAIFFTSDLDAYLLQSAELESTKNLIVVSGFGLELRDELQGEIPPFRRSYQTAAFYGVQLALRSEEWSTNERGADQTRLDRALTPRVFEIGWNGAVDLSPGEDSWNRRSVLLAPYPPARSDAVWLPMALGLLLLFGFSAAVVLAYSDTIRERLRPLANQEWLVELAKRPCSIVLGCALLLATGALVWTLIWIQSGPGAEPLSLFDGVSVWPTFGLRLFAGLLAIGCLLEAWFVLNRNAKMIERHYRLSDPRAPRLRDLRSIVKSLLPWRRQHWSGKEVASAWEAYRVQSAHWPTTARAAMLALLMIALSRVVFCMSGSDFLPARGGDPMWWLNLIVILLLAVLPLLVLTFSTLDITSSCTHLIRHLQKLIEKNGNATQSILLLEGNSTVAQSESTSLFEWEAIQLIAERTEAVGRLVYYPFVVTLVLIVSRWRYFDAWSTSIPLVVVIGITLLFVFLAAVLLRRSAADVLRAALRSLGAKRLRLGGEESNKAMVARIDFALTELRAIKQGAFAPLMEHPLLKTALLVITGVVWLVLEQWQPLARQ